MDSARSPAAVEIHLHIRVKPGGLDALKAFLREATPFYEQPGGIRVTLWRKHDDTEALMERIEYATRADYEADDRRVREDPEMVGYLGRWRELLAGPPVVEVYESEPL